MLLIPVSGRREWRNHSVRSWHSSILSKHIITEHFRWIFPAKACLSALLTFQSLNYSDNTSNKCSAGTQEYKQSNESSKYLFHDNSPCYASDIVTLLLSRAKVKPTVVFMSLPNASIIFCFSYMICSFCVMFGFGFCGSYATVTIIHRTWCSFWTK